MSPSQEIGQPCCGDRFEGISGRSSVPANRLFRSVLQNRLMMATDPPPAVAYTLALLSPGRGPTHWPSKHASRVRASEAVGLGHRCQHVCRKRASDQSNPFRSLLSEARPSDLSAPRRSRGCRLPPSRHPFRSPRAVRLAWRISSARGPWPIPSNVAAPTFCAAVVAVNGSSSRNRTRKVGTGSPLEIQAPRSRDGFWRGRLSNVSTADFSDQITVGCE
jgi:hypothetical protein